MFILLLDDYTIVICEALGAIGSIRSEALLSIVDTVINLLLGLTELTSPSEVQIHTKTMLCTLIFQMLAGYKWNEQTNNTIRKVVDNNNYWANYCIARAAVRYSQHEIAHHILSKLTKEVSSEHFHFWLVCLKEMSEAEMQLYSNGSEPIVNRLNTAIVYYNKAIAALKVGMHFMSSKICLLLLL